ncbi:MAG TPA: anti-sigma F factor [Syntrophomonadaceae bacterium]|nr:anti-sigma F factor [Syntrophomonadaceae bacterium]
MNVKNYVHFEFLSLPENVSFARSCVGAFASQLDCTLEEIEEIKLVVSEAVSNSIIHGYDNRADQQIEITVSILDNRTLEILIEDHGKGIKDVQQALEPTFSSDPARMGLGFTFMKSFMDELDINTQPDVGTIIRLKRSFPAHDKETYA